MEGREPTAQEKSEITRKRNKLFDIIKDLVVWENTTNEAVLNAAREEIRKSWKETCELNKDCPEAATLFNPEKLPAFHDPFAGGGAIPLEAQRLGLESYASDLNPVPVMINKAMIEIPPLFAGNKPVHPKDDTDISSSGSLVYTGAKGLAEDVAYYGSWMREEAFKRIGALYPPVKITDRMIQERPDLACMKGESLTVIAYIWVRTVASPNPAYKNVQVPLASTFVLSKKKGHEAWNEPVISGNTYTFKVHTGKYPKEAEDGTKVGSRDGFKCLLSGTLLPFDYLRDEGTANRINTRLMALVCEGTGGRVYLSPDVIDVSNIDKLTPTWVPDSDTCGKCRVNVGLYGLTTWDKLFTNRQLTALSTFCDILPAAIRKVEDDAAHHGMIADDIGIEQQGTGAKAYAQAVGVYLDFLIEQMLDHSSSICGWNSPNAQMRSTFGRQAIPMTWDYAESNPFSSSTGSFNNMYIRMIESFDGLSCMMRGFVNQCAAQSQKISLDKIISTDPPYYDNIAYADLSDFFYVWMRHNLRDIYPSLFATMATPKDEELVATPYRQGGKEQAETFFLNGMTDVMTNLAALSHVAFPVTIYYAFKQSEIEGNSTLSTGWESFLGAILKAGFMITGTWPMRTEKPGRMIENGTNALASSIVLVCRRRPQNAPSIDRRSFIRELQKTMSAAIAEMTQGSDDTSPVAPVDLSQAIIGPGMAVFSKYKEVLQADGSAMTVHEALRLINASVGSEDDFDARTQFCIDWYKENSWEQGQYGQADVLARAKATSVEALQQDLCVKAGQGKLNLVKASDYDEKDAELPRPGASTWFILHLCISMFQKHGTEGAGQVASLYPEKISELRTLCYRMYTICERAGRMEDAQSYNELMTSWDGVEQNAETTKKNKRIPTLFDDVE